MQRDLKEVTANAKAHRLQMFQALVDEYTSQNKMTVAKALNNMQRTLHTKLEYEEICAAYKPR